MICSLLGGSLIGIYCGLKIPNTMNCVLAAITSSIIWSSACWALGLP